MAGINTIPGIEMEIAERLVSIGLISPEAFEGVSADDLVDSGFSQEEANDILSKVAAYKKENA